MLFLFSPSAEMRYPFALTDKQHAVMRRRIKILGGRGGPVDYGTFWMGSIASLGIAVLGTNLCQVLMRLCEERFYLEMSDRARK